MRTRGLLITIAVMLAPALAHGDDSDQVKVHLTGDPGLVLERKIEGTELWESLCVGTCDMQVPLDGSYRVSGRGVRPSLPIALVPAKNVLLLDTSPAYTAAFAGGVTLVIVGSLAMFGGVVAATIGASQQPVPQECPPDVSCTPQQVNHASLIGGVLAVLTGALAIAGGSVALALGDHTRTRDTVALSPGGLTLKF